MITLFIAMPHAPHTHARHLPAPEHHIYTATRDIPPQPRPPPLPPRPPYLGRVTAAQRSAMADAKSWK